MHHNSNNNNIRLSHGQASPAQLTVLLARGSRHRSQQYMNQYSYLKNRNSGAGVSVNRLEQFYKDLKSYDVVLPELKTRRSINRQDRSEINSKIDRMNKFIINKIQQAQTQRDRNIQHSSQHIYSNSNKHSNYQMSPMYYPQAFPMQYYQMHRPDNNNNNDNNSIVTQRQQFTKPMLKTMRTTMHESVESIPIAKSNKNGLKNQNDNNNNNNKKKKKFRFRIVSIAVYFSIAFPKYSRRFTINRRRYINQLRLPSWSSLKSNIVNTLNNHIHYDNLYKDSLSQQQYELLIDWQDLTQTALTTNHYRNVSQQTIMNIKTTQIINFTTQFLQTITAMITQNMIHFSQIVQFMVAGFTNYSIIRPNLYYEEEATVMDMDIAKCYARMSDRQERMVVMIRIFVGLVVKQALMGKMMVQEKQRLREKYGKQQQFYIREKQINKLRQNSAQFLLQVCQQILQKHKQKQTKQLQPQQQSTRKQKLCYLPKFKSMYLQKQESSPIFQQNINKVTIKSSEFIQGIRQKIMKICSIFKQQIKEQKRKHYEQIKVITLTLKYNEKQGNQILGSSNCQPLYEIQLEKCKAQKKRQVVNNKIIQKLNKKSIKLISTYQKQNQEQNKKQNKFKIQLPSQQSKPERIRKPFHLDVLNAKSKDRRTDQIRQKFRNIFNKK